MLLKMNAGFVQGYCGNGKALAIVKVKGRKALIVAYH
jgi:hypothetical protein